jgi:hypothetical protein
MDAIDECAFMIALERREFGSGVRRAVRQCLIDLRQRHATINLWFPGAEKVEVGAVQNQQSRHGRFYFRGIRGTLALFREICLVSRTRGQILVRRPASAGSTSSRNFSRLVHKSHGSDLN